MKIKKNRLTVIALCTLIITGISCKKSDIINKDDSSKSSFSSLALRVEQKADQPEKVAYYAEKFINDSSMALVFEKFMRSSINIRGVVLNAG